MTDAPAFEPSRLPELIAMAQEGSSERRRTLLRELTDHFFGAPQHSPAEEALYDEVLTRLARDMEEAVRAELSNRISAEPGAPKKLVRRLADDPAAAVASAVLMNSPVLTDDDLLGVVRKHGQEHLRAVSGRATVSEAVSEVIVERGDDQTLGTLLGNVGARLSRTATETAVERAKANPALHAVTVNRADLSPDLLNEMYFVVEARLRQQILEKNARLNPELLESALAAGRNRVALDDGALPADYEDSRAYVQELAAAGQLTPPMLARFLRAPSKTTFLIALSHLADIDFHTARQIIDRKDLDALAVVCKAADLDRTLFLTYAVVLLNDQADAMGRAHSYARMYAELNKDTALRTLRFWRMRRSAAA